MSHRGYWDYFVDQWKTCPFGKNILDWGSPDCVPLYNNSAFLSSCFIPEPWWGNDGNDPLFSVVINYNPGEGGPLQQKGRIDFNTYSVDVVKNNQLCLVETAYWHWKRRGEPIHEAIGLNGTSLKNHLSIELLPWHTQGTTTTYWNYLFQNIKQVYEHCILFAAEESSRIQNPCLRNVVILRINGDKTKKILCEMNNKLGVEICIEDEKDINDGMFLKFKITDNINHAINNVTFVSIWGSNCWNNYPYNLKEIISAICLNKKVSCNLIFSAKRVDNPC